MLISSLQNVAQPWSWGRTSLQASDAQGDLIASDGGGPCDVVVLLFPKHLKRSDVMTWLVSAYEVVIVVT